MRDCEQSEKTEKKDHFDYIYLSSGKGIKSR